MVNNSSMHQGLIISKEKEKGNYYEVMRSAEGGVGSVSVSVMRPCWGNVGFDFPALAQLKSPFVEHTATQTLPSAPATKPMGKPTTNFNLLPGYHKIQETATSLDFQGLLDLGFAPAMVYEYPLQKTLCELFSPRGSQSGGRMMLPLDLTRDDGPTFVNAKQYHGILRRRLSRAKADMKNKLLKQRKPFMHLSRHLHAKRRPRGSGGRFLNTKKLNVNDGTLNKKKNGKLNQPTGSQNSEVVQSNGTNIGSMEEINVIGRMAYNSGSEVTSIFTTGQDCYDFFSLNHSWQSPQPLPNTANFGHSRVLASKWVATTDNSCCNLQT